MDEQFFSVHTDVIMSGVRYIPGICYKVNTVNKEGVKYLYAEGKATYYNKEVRFVSGVAHTINGANASRNNTAALESNQVVLKLR